MPITTRADALVATVDLTQAGVVFNDATRLLEGGLWSNATVQNNQVPALTTYVQDMTAVLNDLQAASGNFATGSAQANDLAAIQKLIPDMINAAQASVQSHGAAQTAAETSLHNDQLQIISTIQNDSMLLAAASNGASGFAAPPAGLPAGVTAANAPVANLADIGALFNDAANLMLGGVNPGNHATIQADLKAAAAGLQNLITNNPSQFGTNGTTADPVALLHVQTIENQLNLQIHKFDNQHGADAGRARNDNMLDIIDIVQGDPILLANATQGGAHGFSPFEDYLHGTINKFQDNGAQTQFWAKFIAGANTLSADANAAVGSTDANAVQAVINAAQSYQQLSAHFVQSQGGVFAARFANELAGHGSTVAADVAGLIQGLKSGDAATVQAATAGLAANAADVSGNNVPVGGGTFNTAGTTVAQALSTAGGSGTTVAASGDPGHTAVPPADHHIHHHEHLWA